MQENAHASAKETKGPDLRRLERSGGGLGHEILGEEEGILVAPLLGNARGFGYGARDGGDDETKNVENADLDSVISEERNKVHQIENERNGPPDEANAIQRVTVEGQAGNGPLQLPLLENIVVHGPLFPEDFNQTQQDSKHHLHGNVPPHHMPTLSVDAHKGYGNANGGNKGEQRAHVRKEADRAHQNGCEGRRQFLN